MEMSSQPKLDINHTQNLNKLLNKEELLIRSEFYASKKNIDKFQWHMLAGGGLILIGCIGLALTGIFFLAMFLEWWKASLIVSLLLISLGGFFYGTGKEQEEESRKFPNRSLKQLNEIRKSVHDIEDKLTRH